MAGKPQQEGAISPGARASALAKSLGSAIRTAHDSEAIRELTALFTRIEAQQKQIAALERRLDALERGRGAGGD